ncbi:MAG: acetolactate synthase small subunit [Oscillospiraceae bacterium]|nr:acetolactate synthase small subunit [Oscillospiraceae bacterium]
MSQANHNSNNNNKEKHTISALVENNAGVLSRISGLFARRGFNIHSLAVGVTEVPDVSRITIVAEGDDYVLEQIAKQLNKLVDVIKVRTLPKHGSELLSRELMLVKVSCTPSERQELIAIAKINDAKISDVSATAMTLELSANQQRLSAFEELIRPYGIKEIARTGVIALQKGATSLNS